MSSRSGQDASAQDVYDMLVRYKARARVRFLVSTPKDDFPSSYWHGALSCIENLLIDVGAMLGMTEEEATSPELPVIEQSEIDAVREEQRRGLRDPNS